MMFKKMRNRILLVNMTIITTLVGILLAVVYLTTYNRIEIDNQAELEHISRWDFFTTATAAGEAVITGDFTLSVSAAAPRLYLPPSMSVSDSTGMIWRGDSIMISSFRAAPRGQSRFGGGITAGPDTTTVHSVARAETDKAMIRMAPTDMSHSFHVIVDAQGEVIRINSYTSLSEEACSEAAATVWESGRATGTFKTGDHTLMYTVQPINARYLVYEQYNNAAVARLEPTGHRITFLDVTTSRNTLNQLLTTELAAAAVGLVFIFAISFFFATRSIAPIARSWDQQKQFVADASHELKTPLAIIGANSDALLANPFETVDSQRIWVDYIKAETARMGRLVNSLLELAHTESFTAAVRQPFDLSELSTDAVLTMEAVAFEKGLPLAADIAPGLCVTACREDIARVMLILLDNAVKYTQTGGTIRVALAAERRQAVFTVHNSGAGVPEDVLSRMFDRFYRADQTRNQDSGSFGLGLSIAKNIIEQNGGTISAASRPDEGVTLSFALPL